MRARKTVRVTFVTITGLHPNENTDVVLPEISLADLSRKAATGSGDCEPLSTSVGFYQVRKKEIAVIERPEYLKQLVGAMGNGMVKIITGIRRCGKSYLLSTLFREHQRSVGADDAHVHAVARTTALRGQPLPRSSRSTQLTQPMNRQRRISPFPRRRCGIASPTVRTSLARPRNPKNRRHRRKPVNPV